MAWLSAIPEKQEAPRRVVYQDGSPYLQLITLTEYEQYLVGLWTEVGTISQSGMGIAPLLWTEISAWSEKFYNVRKTQWVEVDSGVWKECELIESSLLDYELLVVQHMSQEYCSEYGCKELSQPCPKQIDLDEVNAFEESLALGNMLRGLFGKFSE